MPFADLPVFAPLTGGRQPRTLLSLALLVLAALCVGRAGAMPAAEQLIHRQAELLKQGLAEAGAHASDPAELERLVNRVIAPHVDFNRFARLVLGRYWRTLSREDRRRFEQGLERLVIRTYSTALAGASDLDIRYPDVPARSRPGRVVVPTVISSVGNPPVKVNYKLYEREGVWRVYDVVIEGISMAVNYRSLMAERIRRQGIDAVIDGLAGSSAALATGR